MKTFENPVVSTRSMPFWCVGNPLADPFGGVCFIIPIFCRKSYMRFSQNAREGSVKLIQCIKEFLISQSRNGKKYPILPKE